jgi:hypothetical protein
VTVVIAAPVFTNRLIALDKQEMQLYGAAVKRDGIKENVARPKRPRQLSRCYSYFVHNLETAEGDLLCNSVNI